MARFYSDSSPRSSAAEIAAEVIRTGQSSGWAARTLATLHAVEAILAPFGIEYACDFHGRWAPATAPTQRATGGHDAIDPRRVPAITRALSIGACYVCRDRHDAERVAAAFGGHVQRLASINRWGVAR